MNKYIFNEKEFKVGDRVRCTNCSLAYYSNDFLGFKYLVINKIYTIKAIYSNGMLNFEGVPLYGYYPLNFELYSIQEERKDKLIKLKK